jgi:hypothetical protein
MARIEGVGHGFNRISGDVSLACSFRANSGAALFKRPHPWLNQLEANEPAPLHMFLPFEFSELPWRRLSNCWRHRTRFHFFFPRATPTSTKREGKVFGNTSYLMGIREEPIFECSRPPYRYTAGFRRCGLEADASFASTSIPL